MVRLKKDAVGLRSKRGCLPKTSVGYLRVVMNFSGEKLQLSGALRGGTLRSQFQQSERKLESINGKTGPELAEMLKDQIR